MFASFVLRGPVPTKLKAIRHTRRLVGVHVMNNEQHVGSGQDDEIGEPVAVDISFGYLSATRCSVPDARSARFGLLGPLRRRLTGQQQQAFADDTFFSHCRTPDDVGGEPAGFVVLAVEQQHLRERDAVGEVRPHEPFDRGDPTPLV